MPSFFFRELQLITVLLLICDSYMSLSCAQPCARLSKTVYGIFHTVNIRLTQAHNSVKKLSGHPDMKKLSQAQTGNKKKVFWPY